MECGIDCCEIARCHLSGPAQLMPKAICIVEYLFPFEYFYSLTTLMAILIKTNINTEIAN